MCLLRFPKRCGTSCHEPDDEDGGFNLLNTPDELYVSPSQFWNEYNKPWLDNAIEKNDILDWLLLLRSSRHLWCRNLTFGQMNRFCRWRTRCRYD